MAVTSALPSKAAEAAHPRHARCPFAPEAVLAHCQMMRLDPPQPCFCSAAGVKHSAAYVQGLVDKEIAAGIRSDRIVVAGFSQGGHLALKTALFCPQRLAGCVALSTWLEPLKEQVMGCSKPCLYGRACSPGQCSS